MITSLKELTLHDVSTLYKKSKYLVGKKKSKDNVVLVTSEMKLYSELVKNTRLYEDGYIFIKELTISKWTKSKSHVDYIKDEFDYGMVMYDKNTNGYTLIQHIPRALLQKVATKKEDAEGGVKIDVDLKLFKDEISELYDKDAEDAFNGVQLTNELLVKTIKADPTALILYLQDGLEEEIPLTVGLLVSMLKFEESNEVKSTLDVVNYLELTNLALTQSDFGKKALKNIEILLKN